MYDFLDRLITIAMPRIRDFRGVKPSFDGRGNFAMGIKEHIVFPEIKLRQGGRETRSLGAIDAVIMVTTAATDAEAKSLLKHFNMPFNRLTRRRTRTHGKESNGRTRTEASEAGGPISPPSARRLRGNRERRRQAHGRAGSRRASSWRNCPATPLPTRLHNRCQLTGRPHALLPQAARLADHASGTGLQWPDPRHGQVELVRRSDDE